MIWVGTLVLASLTAVISPPAGPVASTYDEAACAEAAREPQRAHPVAVADGAEEQNCSEPPASAVPAVIDCNDQRASLWVGDMIGSCDMPRPSLPSPIMVVVRPAGPSGRRICDGFRCAYDAHPLRPASRASDEGARLTLGAARFVHYLVASPLVEVAQTVPKEARGDRLERPPRAS
jgi:hypothetical protein